MTFDSWTLWRLVIIVALAAGLVAVFRFLKPFFWRITICTVAVVVAAIICGDATARYLSEGGGFKLGVDLAGGTILVYEVDGDKMTEKQKEDFKLDQLASRLKHRLDPNDLYNITIRPVPAARVENTRVEIILPTGGQHQEEVEQRAWEDLIAKSKSQYSQLSDTALQAIPRGNTGELSELIRTKAGVSADIAEAFVKNNWRFGKEKRDVTSEQVQKIKNLISKVGALEFRILANDTDDKEAITKAEAFFKDASNKNELKIAAEKGLPPPAPTPDNGPYFNITNSNGDKTDHTYAWVEMGKKERWDMGLNNDAGDPWDNLIAHVKQKWSGIRPSDLEDIKRDDDNGLAARIVEKGGVSEQAAALFIRQHKRIGLHWQEAKDAREKGVPFRVRQDSGDKGSSTFWIFGRDCVNAKLTEQQQKEKKYEYFMLTRNPEIQQTSEGPKAISITGDMLTAFPEMNQQTNSWVVGFQFDTAGGNLFYNATSKNVPSGQQGSQTLRHLAIILDGEIISSPSVHTAIRERGMIEGNYTQEEVQEFVNLLKSGNLPAPLKPNPVSENTLGSTLGQDTVIKGTRAVGIAFAAVLFFMVIYYRFAGFVACVALLANLLMTIAFMVVVSATFTLPGLAGLVLMIGMAVDANVLIYERLREERDRGASLPLAIRNGYDRAFPTIIDTHLSSIFTAIVLYVVGNDQLKGFGISLAVGLFISLFTSLYMTRLLFDLWQNRGWLKKLSMFRLLSKPNINFMAIRYYWFAATIIFTIFGISVFIGRLPEDLNIDFNGGTLYGGQLAKNHEMDIQGLRQFFSEEKQAQLLKVKDVRELLIPGEEGLVYAITYEGDTEPRTIHFPNKPEGGVDEVRKRASVLPDATVEMIFPQGYVTTDNKTPFFNLRTTEKAPELVQAEIVRLLGPELKQTLMQKVAEEPKGALFGFTYQDTGATAYASPSMFSTLLQRECKKQGFSESFQVFNEGTQAANASGQYTQLRVAWTDRDLPKAKMDSVLAAVQKEFDKRPVPDRLENFDKQLAQDTQRQAMYAILASWGALLFYLWFRFGSWTFGLAAVLCLIHDLFFTLGIIAFCHYIHGTWFGNALLIEDFKIDLPAIAALLTLVGYSVSDTIVVFDRIREVRGKNPELTPQTINDSVNQTLSRTLLTAFSVFLVVLVLYIWGGEGIHLFAFVMVVGVVVGTYSSIYIASPLLLIFGEGRKQQRRGAVDKRPVAATV